MKVGVAVEMTNESGDPGFLARYLEDAGFASIVFPEHIAIPVENDTYYRWGNEGQLPDHYTRWPDPYIALAVAAAATTNLTLATGISLLPQHDPVRLAKTIASLDFYSGGRTIFAFGVGWLKAEIEAFGVDFPTRWEHYAESLDALKALWSGEVAEADGKFVRFPPLIPSFRAAQPGGPKRLVGVHKIKRAIPLVVNHADGWYPLIDDIDEFVGDVTALRNAAESAGRDPQSIVVLPILKPPGDELSDHVLEVLHTAGVEHFVLHAEDQGARTTTGRAPEFIDAVQPIVERAAAYT